MKIIGLDVGEKRIGVAKVDSTTRIAVPVGFVLVDGSEWQEIAKIANLNNTNLFILGLPRSNEGNETAQSLYVRNFARALAEKVPGARVRFQDESLTSVEAENRLKQRGKKYEKGDIDAEAASIILQDFIESFKVSDLNDNSETTTEDGKNKGRKKKSPDEIMEQITENTKNIAKKGADKANFEVQKAKYKSKKFSTLLIIPPVVIVLILVGLTIALKVRDHIRAEREAEYRRQEAEMLAETFDFTIAPGETIFDIKKNLAKAGYTQTEIDEAFNYNYSAQEGLEYLSSRPAGATLEGYLYGETYNFYKETSVKDILATFLELMGNTIQENDLEAKYKERGLSLHEGITLASVVQKEASSPEQPTVAQVFLTRLGLGIPMGSDVTVSYALDIIDPAREMHPDNESALVVDSCYNTRVHAGLPCGPISNPGLSALLAVANPSDTEYLYFLTGDDGVMYYSYTEYEHNQNAYLHCQELCNISL